MATLDDADVEAAVSHLDWTREGDALVKVVTKADFAEAMQFVNAVADMAESVNHHPDIAISWNKVTLNLSTHSEGGITQADIDLAGGIDGLTA
ncbi:MAG: 4a-hydroxytetrahydrobiopterin dehydratase [Actinobacteria bacterium]|nr:4a-hydroxytetrahydrobiopterin dehydratase [Actinomycetota bacterium]MBV9936142.1 4a-hydroxytetrahydrobiopterin dehydratase [Actinomycetota bacterium]